MQTLHVWANDSPGSSGAGALPALLGPVTTDRLGVTARTAAIASFVRRFRTEILARWRVAARSIPAAEPLSAVTLVDHMPELLDQIGEHADVFVEQPTTGVAFETAQRHAIDRLAAGFDVYAVVSELSLLRSCILEIWARENEDANTELRALNLAIDRAIAVSVSRYENARERTLAAVDRISTASFESHDLHDLLGRLLHVFAETTPSVDTAAIFLLEGDRLHLRAMVGLDQGLEDGFSLGVGEGFAGTVAARREPIALRAAYLDSLVVSEEIKAKRIRALYGIPLIQGERLIGVAHMGSLTAHEFSHEDTQFFGSMVGRATSGIYHHLLREELAESERRYKEIALARELALSKLEALLAASPVGIAFVDRDLRYLRINEALAQLNGRPVAEHIGRTVAEVLGEAARPLEPLLRRALAGESILNLQFTTPDGRNLLGNYFPVRGAAGEVTGLGAIAIDVTEEKRAQEALEREQARLRSILEYSPAAIWVKDADGKIVLANERLAVALGCPRERLIGRRSDEVLPPETAEQHQTHDRMVLAENRSIEVEEVLPAGDGVKTFLAIKFPIPGNPPLVGGIATEISERKHMEDELRAAVRTREDILAVVSHDLRNPLATVQLGTSMLQSLNPTDHRTRRHLEMIHRASQRMETLIDDLLDTANIRAGHLTLETQREAVDTVLAEALELQQPPAVEKGIQLGREGSVQGVEVVCDRDRILQVLGNLIGNAIKFCRAGDTITVRAELVGDDVRVSVADNGPGIEADIVPHLFDAYWSAPEHSKRGSGLGLYICRGIVEGHGGRIWAESAPGSGATLFFTLPIAK